MLRCGTGADPNTDYGIRTEDHANRPANSAKISVQGNHMTAGTRFQNNASLTEITTADAAQGGSTHVTDMQDVSHAGSGAIITAAERTAIGTLQTDVSALQGSDLVVQSTTGSASIKIESNTDVQGGHSSLQLFSNSASDGDDRHWKFNTDHGNSDALVLTCESTSFGTKEALRFGPTGAVSFGAGGTGISNVNVAGFQVRKDAWFRETLRTSGDIYLDAGATVRRTDANGDDLLAGGGGSSGPTALFGSGHGASHTLDASVKDVMWPVI